MALGRVANGRERHANRKREHEGRDNEDRDRRKTDRKEKRKTNSAKVTLLRVIPTMKFQGACWTNVLWFETISLIGALTFYLASLLAF